MHTQQSAIATAPTTTKKCRLCRKKKPVSEFSRNGKTTDGLRNECSKCQYAYYGRARTAREVHDLPAGPRPTGGRERACSKCGQGFKQGKTWLTCEPCFEENGDVVPESAVLA